MTNDCCSGYKKGVNIIAYIPAGHGFSLESVSEIFEHKHVYYIMCNVYILNITNLDETIIVCLEFCNCLFSLL